jgi:hypothetical protein
VPVAFHRTSLGLNLRVSGGHRHWLLPRGKSSAEDLLPELVVSPGEYRCASAGQGQAVVLGALIDLTLTPGGSATCTGVLLSVVVPSPGCPKKL